VCNILSYLEFYGPNIFLLENVLSPFGPAACPHRDSANKLRTVTDNPAVFRFPYFSKRYAVAMSRHLFVVVIHGSREVKCSPALGTNRNGGKDGPASTIHNHVCIPHLDDAILFFSPLQSTLWDRHESHNSWSRNWFAISFDVKICAGYWHSHYLTHGCPSLIPRF
jgi:hypothetical protein